MRAQHKNLRGKLDYIYEGNGRDEEFGREWFSLTHHADGQHTLRAQCEIEAGFVAPRSVIRDVTYTLDEQYRPLDCFVRLQQSGQHLGTGWFRFDEHQAVGTVRHSVNGDIHQQFSLDRRPPSVGSHPLWCDMFHCLRFDHGRAERVQISHGVMMTSLELDGCSGPLLTSFDLDIEFLGKETVTVPAGTFDTEHYRFPSESFPEEHVWFVREPLLFVLVTVGGHMRSRYELVQLERDAL
jgi:hypothetical protein